MKKIHPILSIAAIGFSLLGAFYRLLPDFVNAPLALEEAYGCLFQFSSPHGVLNSILLLLSLLLSAGFVFFLLRKKVYGFFQDAFLLFLSLFLLLLQGKPLVDGLNLMGTAFVSCLFAFLGVFFSVVLIAFDLLSAFEVLPRGEKQESKKGKSFLLSGLSGMGILFFSAVIAISSSMLVGMNAPHDVEEHVSVSKVKKAYFAQGRGTYDLDGNLFTLRGVNFGNYFIQEGWLGPVSLGAKKNPDGSYVKINEDGIVEEYEETYQEELEQALLDNPNLSVAQVESLWDAYYTSYAQNEDFANIKNLGLNGIRLPMYYGNFVQGEAGNLQWKENAFHYLDRFLDMAKANGLLVVLDMHGLEGGQSGYEHSGSRKCEFWEKGVYQNDMADLWQGIALHYRDERPDLFSTIFAFDLANEPTPKQQSGSAKKQWDALDKLYRAIREVDEDHIIMFEGVWEFSNLPDHLSYGWENVVYEFHFYNWNSGTVPNDLFWAAMNMALSKSDAGVPYYIGEFTFFDDKETWVKMLRQFDEWHYSWSLWTYKVACVGWWDNSWGIYVDKMNLKNGQLKVDLRSASYEEILAVWAHQGTSESYSETGVTYQALQEYSAIH
ncbi:MAG: cellulase family glycosylhydrolase [Bacilli bacterium]|nr:cellulase family glycosylhydrolase [Bacilli bacterium]